MEKTIELALKTLVEQDPLHAGNTVVFIRSISAGEKVVDPVEMRVG